MTRSYSSVTSYLTFIKARKVIRSSSVLFCFSFNYANVDPHSFYGLHIGNEVYSSGSRHMQTDGRESIQPTFLSAHFEVRDFSL